MPEVHHIHGPSTLKDKAICPGWKKDELSDKSAADEGTLLHHAAETGSLEGLTPEQVSCVQPCLLFCEKIERTALQVLKETRLSILGGLTFGTCDRLIRATKTHAELVDFKFGRTDVTEAKDNVQGWAYALGAFELWPDVQTVRVWFLLPRLDKISHHTFHRRDYNRMATTVRAIISRCDAYDRTKDASMLNRTEAGCLYCGAKDTCPKFVEYALGTLRKYEPLEIVDEVHSSAITDPEKMARLFSAAKLLEKMVDSVKAHALELALQNGGLPGYEIAERNGNRELRDLGLALPVLSEYLEDREILSAAKVSLPAVLKLIAEKQPKGQKSKVLGAVERALADAQAVTSGEPMRYLKKIKATA